MANNHYFLQELGPLHFTLKQLRYVEATGRLGSIAKAAKELAISQSSITAAIDALENSLNYDLFIRTPAKGIKVTSAGEEALSLIRSYIHQGQHFETELQSVGGDASGNIRIACYATAAPSFLPPILKSFTQSHPGVSIKLLEGNMDATMSYLNNGEADLAFTYDEVVESAHDFVPLFGAPPYALLPIDDPLSKASSVTFADLAKRPMVMLDLPRTREYFVGMFSHRGLVPNIVHSTRSAEITRALVAAGYGYSILNILPPDYRPQDSRFRVLPIQGDVHTPIFGIATQALERQPQMVQSFINQCLSLSGNGAFKSIIVA